MGRSAKVAALAAALRAALDDEVDALAGELISELDAHPGRVDALAALAGAWDRLSPDARDTALAVGGDRWTKAAADLLSSTDPTTRRGGATVVGALGLVSQAEGLVPLLAETGPTAEAADVALRSLITDGVPEGAVVRAISAACRSADAHRRPVVVSWLAKALWAREDLGACVATVPLRGWLGDPAHAAHLVIRSVLRRGRDSRLDLLAWRWLPRPAVSASCAARLLDHAAPDATARVRAQWALWLNPARGRALARAARGTLIPAQPPTPSAPLAQRLGFVHAAARLPHDHPVRDALLAAMLTDPDPRVRLAIVRLAAEVEPAPGCLTDLAFDTDARVATSAAGVLLCPRGRAALAGAERIALARTLTRSAHPAVRALASDVLRAPARARGAGFISAAQPDEALAPRIARWCRVTPTSATVGDLAEFIREGAAEQRPRARATALVVISRARDDQYDGLLVGATRDPDPRVRANALEAAYRRARRARAASPFADVLRAGIDDPAPRAAAAAVRGVLSLQPRSAAPDRAAQRRTLSLLTSTHAPDRLAGLWLVARLADRFARVAPVLDAVATITKAPASPRERARAQHAADRLLWHVREGWKARAAGVRSPPATAEAAA